MKIINLVVSLICVSLWGIYGVLFGTVAALLYRTNDIIIYANYKIMKRSPWPTYKRWFINIGPFLLAVGITSKLEMTITSYGSLVMYAIPVSACIALLFFAAPFIYEKGLAQFAKSFLMKKNKNKS